MPTKKRLQKLFVAGLLVWLPLVITVWMLLWMLRLVDSIFIALVAALERFVSPLNGFSQWVHSFPGFGVAVLGLMILVTGLLVSNIVGAWWLRQWDKMLVHIPVFRSIYSSVKQVSDTLFSGGGKAFSKALEVNENSCMAIDDVVLLVTSAVKGNNQQTPQFGKIQGLEDENGTFFFMKK